MRREDWQQAFGSTPEAFERRVRNTLDGLQEEKKVKKKLSVSVAAALIAAVLLMGTAFAVTNGLNMADMLLKWNRSVPRLMMDAVEKPAVTAETERMTYTVQEVLLDAHWLRAVVVCEAKDPTHWLPLGADEEPELDSRMPNGDSLADGDDEAELITIKALAERNGQQTVTVFPFLENAEWGTAHEDYCTKDGKLYYYLAYELDAPMECDANGQAQIELTMNDYTLPDSKDRQTARLPMTVSAIGTSEIREKTISLADRNIRIGIYLADSVNVSLSDYEVRVDVQLHVAEDASQADIEADDFYGFLLVNEDGTEQNGFESGSMYIPDEAWKNDEVQLKPGMNISCSLSYLLDGGAPEKLLLRAVCHSEDPNEPLEVDLTE